MRAAELIDVADKSTLYSISGAALAFGAAAIRYFTRKKPALHVLTAGEQPREYWEKTISEIVQRRNQIDIVPTLNRFSEFAERQLGIEERQTEILITMQRDIGELIAKARKD